MAPHLTRLSAFAVIAVAASAAVLLQEARPPASDLVLAQEGNLPLILSAPHGGQDEVPGVPPRRGVGIPPGGRGFVAGRDSNTELLTQELAAAVERRMARRPYLVVARFHRKFIDANRPVEIGCEHPLSRAVYDTYHDTLGRYCRDVQSQFGRGLLLDFHGQGVARDTVFRGTQNGKSVTLLTQRFGAKSHNGAESFFGLLAAQGWNAEPVDDSREHAGFTGGYIVQTYGSHTGYGIDAIQLEFGNQFRERGRFKETAKKLAEVIDEFAKRYLPDKPLTRTGRGRHMEPTKTETATLAGGCFWCLEAVFEELRGVGRVVSGYTGGTSSDPSYREVCGGDTGHAEVVQITFDPSVISYRELLEVFFATHDPTTLNRQGGDVGTQYRSEIYYHSPEQKQIAEGLIRELNSQGIWPNSIVTVVSSATKFFAAEDYHQGYFRANPTAGYCQAVVSPKLAKFRKSFSSKLKR